MKNTQRIALHICIGVLIISVVATVYFSNMEFYAGAFIGMFISLSSFVITFLFNSRVKCMEKMLDGRDLIASWQYSIETTKEIENEMKKDKAGSIILAIPFFSFVIIVIVLTVSFASENIGLGFIITLFTILMNVLFFKLLMRTEGVKGISSVEEVDMKKSYVYISSTGIYAYGMLNVWKGWGSKLIEVCYQKDSRYLSFEYSYIRPYSFARYTVSVYLPEDKEDLLKNIQDTFIVKLI